MQFKQGGHAELKNVHIVVYGKNHDRYDQIYGDHFTYDPQTGDIKAVGEVHIDLQGNAEGPSKPDQAAPAELKNPLHLVTQSLTFNQKTGIAQTDEVVNFQTEQAAGSAKGALLRLQAERAAAEVRHPHRDHRRPSGRHHRQPAASFRRCRGRRC